jgi:two-component system, OmpR family, phosphate regulon sensor histidine kinase PhoR
MMMIRSAVFQKLLLSAFLLILTTVAGIDFLLRSYTTAREREQVERRMETSARVLGAELPAVERARLELWAKQAESLARARVTVIDRNGIVLADSQHDPDTMENHSRRPEVIRALEGQTGSATRHSATLNVDFCYLALPATYGGNSGAVLRLAVPLAQVQGALAELRWRVLRASAISAVLSLFLAFYFSRAFSRRIQRIQKLARGLLESRFADSGPPEPEDELGDLSRSLRAISDQLRNTLDRLSVESARRDAILASMVEGVLAVDSELRVTFCNESFADAVGARWPVPERLPLLQLVREPSFLDLLTCVLATGEPTRKKLTLTGAKLRVYTAQAAPLESRPQRGAIAILHDISEIERLERVRTDFVANLSHELRTPLTAIRGFAETLLSGALEDTQNSRKFLQIILAQSVRLNGLAADLLVLSELESDRATTPPERIPVRDAIQSALYTVESEAQVRNVAVLAGAMGDLHIMGQRFGLEQALVNLLTNGIKFNRPGGKVLVQTAMDDGEVRITVSDTGIGIPSEDLPRIFERFYCVDKARSREVGGTGLGLSIVKHVVEKMNGSVGVESQLGKGSTFTLRFPAA